MRTYRTGIIAKLFRRLSAGFAGFPIRHLGMVASLGGRITLAVNYTLQVSKFTQMPRAGISGIGRPTRSEAALNNDEARLSPAQN
jgi:hypothetical protein